MTKPCIGCGVVLPLSHFYGHPKMRDGRLNKCKPCVKQAVAERSSRMVATPEGLAAERARGREKYLRLYRGQPRSSPRPVALGDSVKRAARVRLGNAVRDGLLSKPSQCEDCGAQPPSRWLHGHHEDYNAPLAVNWLCSACHGVRHRLGDLRRTP